MLSHLDAAIAGVSPTCREPVVSAVAGEERVMPSLLKHPETMARDEIEDDEWRASCKRDGFKRGVRASRSHLAGLLDGIRAKHSAAGVLDPVGYAAEVLGLVARMGREG